MWALLVDVVCSASDLFIKQAYRELLLSAGDDSNFLGMVFLSLSVIILSAIISLLITVYPGFWVMSLLCLFSILFFLTGLLLILSK